MKVRPMKYETYCDSCNRSIASAGAPPVCSEDSFFCSQECLQKYKEETCCRTCKKDIAYAGTDPWRSEDGVFCSQDCLQKFKDRKSGIKEVVHRRALLGCPIFGSIFGAWAIYGLVSGQTYFPPGEGGEYLSGWITRSDDPFFYWTIISLELGFFLALCGWWPIHYFRNRKSIRIE